MPEAADAIEQCTEQMKQIGRALAQYRSEKGELPARLEDLHPHYLADSALFRCPADSANAGRESEADPARCGSYSYEMSTAPAPQLGIFLGKTNPPPGASWRDRKESQRIHFGDRAPVVRCGSHPGISLNLTLSDEVYRSGAMWELDPGSRQTVVDRMIQALEHGTFESEWSAPLVLQYLHGWLKDGLPPADRLCMARAGEAARDRSEDGTWRQIAIRLLWAGGRINEAAELCATGADQQPLKYWYAQLTGADRRWSAARRVREYLEAERVRQQVPGLSVMIAQDGEPILAEGLGHADLENQVPATEETVYQIGSITKQFTAVAIRMLEREGKLSLSDSVVSRLPDLPETWSDVTVWHLLTHTSGIPSYTGLPHFMETVRKDFTADELIGLVRDLPLEFTPGERLSYNNSAYFLLGMIIEAASGQTYGQFLKERIFSPAGMEATRVNERAAIVPRRARGYSRSEDRIENAEFVSPTQPFSAGVILSTVLDLARWDRALNGDTVLPRPVLQEMWQRIHLNDGSEQPFGQGWMRVDHQGHTAVVHGGGIHGFLTFFARLIDLGLSIAVFTNADFTDPGALAFGAIDRFLANAKTAAGSSPATTRLVRKILREAGKGELNGAHLSPEILTSLKAAVPFYQGLGTLRSCRPIEQQEDSGAKKYSYETTFDSSRWVHFIELNDDRITALKIAPEGF